MKLYSICAMIFFATGEASRNLRVADDSTGVQLIGGSGGLGPDWTMGGDKEEPAGTKDMGGWTAAVYTKEQQKRLGVDQFGNKPNEFGNKPNATAADGPSDVNGVIGMIGGSNGLGPKWTTNQDKEAPAGTKDMGGWTAAVYTKEQQQRLGVDEFGNKSGATVSGGPSDVNGVIGMVGGSGGVGPAWTYDPSVEKPAGTKDMGGWTSAVYTKEQQQRLGVDENGHAKAVVVSAS